jgi:hypothetical protein
MTGWTIHYDATCANGTAASLAIFKSDNCDDSRTGPFLNSPGTISPQLLEQCLNSGVASISFYCDGANDTINVSDGRPAPTLYPPEPA